MAPPQSAEPTARWHNVHPDYLKVRMLNANSGWAVGAYGAITGYSGGRWRQYASPVTNTLFSVYALNESDAWAVGYDNVILHLVGGDWTRVAGPAEDTCFHDLWMVSASDGWAVGTANCDFGRDNGAIFHYNGSGWQPVTLPANTYHLNAIQMLSASEGWAVGNYGTILHYAGGVWVKFTNYNQSDIYSIAMLPNGSEGWAGFAGSQAHSYSLHYINGMWREDRSGQTNASHPEYCTSGCRSYGYGVAALSPTQRIVVGYDDDLNAGYVLASAYGIGDGSDNNWLYQGSVEANELNSVYMVAANDAWLVGESGYIGHYDGAHVTMVEGARFSVNGLAYNNTRNELYQVGYYVPNADAPLVQDGHILASNTLDQSTVVSCTTTGTSWSAVATLNSSNLDAWVVGDSGHLAHVTNAGCEVSQVGSATLHSIAWVSPTLGLAGGDNGMLLFYDSTWHMVGYLGNSALYGLSYKDERWWASSSGAIYTTNLDPRNPANWKVLPLSSNNPVYSIAGVSDTEAWAVGGDATTSEGIRYHITNITNVEQQNSPDLILNAIFMFNGNEGWAGGEYGSLEHYHAGAWDSVTHYGAGIYSLLFTSRGEGWAGGHLIPASFLMVGSVGELQHYYTACYDYYNDVTEGSWAYSYIHDLSCRGVINGTSSHTFSPNAPATRSQFAKIITLARGWAVVTPSAATFSDVGPGNPLWQFVETAYQHGAISGAAPALCTARGRANPCYLPDDPISRVQATVIVARAFAWPVNTSGGPHFTDLPPTGFGYAAVETAYNRAVVSGIGGGLFAPNASVSRAQISKIVDVSIYSP